MNDKAPPFMRQTVLDLEESRIREVANAGMGRPDVLAFWFGESDEVTPDVVRQAAIDSMQRGETFYSHNLGLPELRQAVSEYMSSLHGPIHMDRIAITSGGVNALMLAAQALIDAGDEVVAVTPVWPNLTAQALVMGAHLKCVALRPVNGQWQLNMAALKAAITPTTRMLIVNSPNNPTGWTLSRAEQAEILAHCRSTGTWVLADEVYERLYYDTDTPNAGDATGHDAAHGQADRVQHLLRLGLHPAGRCRRFAKHRQHHTPRGRPPQSLPRYPGAPLASRAGRASGSV